MREFGDPERKRSGAALPSLAGGTEGPGKRTHGSSVPARKGSHGCGPAAGSVQNTHGPTALRSSRLPGP